jgi:thiamine-monophosphate kinase
MNEFDLIRRYFNVETADHTELGIGDDAAIVRPSPDCDVHVAVDTLVSGRHFFADVDPAALGHKALAVNLSDMAAMGAQPRWALLALTLPRVDDRWLTAFAGGFFALARQYGVTLIGGDTTRGPLTLSITVMGESPRATALCRHAAQPDDDIWVSGQLGLAALALKHHPPGPSAPPADVLAACRRRLEWPSPRVALGLALRPLAHACIDVSDGLMADLGHIVARSGLAAEVWLDALPTHPWLADRRAQHIDCLAAGGDDYELCFTAPAHARGAIAALTPTCPLTRIGRMHAAPGTARLLDSAGNDISIGRSGFDHFQDQA